jgi:protein SCO1
MRRALMTGLLGAGLSLNLAGGAVAHSLHELEEDLREREAYVQFMDQPAPEFTLQDATGRTVSLSDFRGKVVVLWFIFASCTEACPIQSRMIADLQEAINRTPMQELVQFVSITTDPERDTPEVLEAYGPEQGLDPANWVLLTSGPLRPEATRELAARYGLEFTVMDDGDQMHGVVTHLIDRGGVLRARYHGLRFDPTNVILHVNALTHDHGDAIAGEPSLWQRLRGLLPW